MRVSGLTMAACRRFVCNCCSKAIESWDEGNPYFIDKKGKKQYAYHPSSLRNQCIANDSPHLCLACGREFKVDSRAPIDHCPQCKSTEIVDTFGLSGQTCPFCKKGEFAVDPDFFCIS